MKNYNRLTEDLRLSDLMKHAGISKLTKVFMKDRLARLGGKKSGTLLKIKVVRNRGYIDFTFVSTPTYGTEGVMITKPRSMRLVPADEYDQTIRIIDFFKLIRTNPDFTSYKNVTIDDIKEVIRNADVKVWCDCPSMHWQGMNYYLTQFDGSLHPTSIAPQVWNKKHHDDNLVCKHLDLILSQTAFYTNIMASMILKYLKNN